MKRLIHLGLLLTLLLILPFGCQKELDELPDIPKERSISKRTPEEIPKIIDALHTSLGMSKENDQIFSVNYGSFINDFSVDMDRIMEVVDTIGNQHYTFAIEDNDSNPFIFYNLIISTDQFGTVKRPYLLRYEMSDEFIPVYLQTQSIQGFAGTIRRTYLIPRSNGTTASSASPNSLISVSAGEDTCDDSEGSGGSSDPGSGGGDPVDSGPTPIDDPDPWGNFGGTPCDIYWQDFASESCGENCVTARQSILIIDCGESDGGFSRAGEDDCNDGAEIIVLPEGEIILDPSFKDTPKAMCIYTKLSQTGIMSTYLNRFDADFTLKDLQWHVVTSLPNYVNGKTYANLDGFYKIEINGNTLFDRTNLEAAKTMMHELIHAELARKVHSVNSTVDPDDFPGIYDYYRRFIKNWEHQQMAGHFTGIIGEALWEFDNKQKNLQYYKDLAWGGLRRVLDHNNPGTNSNPNFVETAAWQSLSAEEQARINNNITAEKTNGSKTCID